MEMVVTVAHNIYVIAAVQHNNRVAPHSTEFRFAQISSLMPARLPYQEITTGVQRPCSGLDGQREPSWTLTLYAIYTALPSHT